MLTEAFLLLEAAATDCLDVNEGWKIPVCVNGTLIFHLSMLLHLTKFSLKYIFFTLLLWSVAADHTGDPTVVHGVPDVRV